MTKEKEIIGGLNDYTYRKGDKIEIEGQLLQTAIMLLDKAISGEVRAESPFKYHYVNVDSGKVVKEAKEKDIISGKVKKVLNFEKTIVNPTIEYSISEKGLAYAEFKNILESIHYDNIKKGVAVRVEDILKSNDFSNE